MASDLLVWLFPVSEGVLALLKRADRKAARAHDRGTMWVMWTTIAWSIAAAVVLRAAVPQARLPGSNALRNGVSTGLLVVGLTIRWYAILYLGRYFTVNVTISQDHELIRTGPYRWVRHPSYTGLMLAFGGVAAFAWNWLSIPAMLVPISCALALRISKEEEALRRHFGEAWDAYSKRTGRLLPKL